jgi:prepilin-type N-terminal cleavage/methylation domain-containing protein
MKKGFTLIEMAVVLLIIGILAGIVLRNIAGQTPIARDTRRVGDLRNTATYLATYLTKFGQFPTTTNSGVNAWSELESKLRAAGITDRLPRDPSTGQGYSYYFCSDIGSVTVAGNPINHFVLGAILEQPQSAAPRLWDTASTGTPSGWFCNVTTLPCDPANRQYCVAQ